MMKTQSTILSGRIWSVLAALAVAGLAPVHSAYAEPDADAAWEAIENKLQALNQVENPSEIEGGLRNTADEAGAFAKAHPDHEMASEARITRLQLLGSLISITGDPDGKQEKELVALLDAGLGDKSLPEDERVAYFALKTGQLKLLKKVKAMRENPDPAAFAGFQNEIQKIQIETLIAASKEFPGNEGVYLQLVSAARAIGGDEGKAIAKHVLASEDAPQSIKAQASEIAEGRKPYELGKPLDITFTAVDGRDVDLSKMKGKVILIDFWATWCGPCVAELPHVKAVYEKYNDKGFEIVGISFDNDKGALTSFTAQKNMPWPQYFDGKGWGNSYGQRFGINSIPTMWLVDKEGNLADLNAWRDLDEKVAKLLAAGPKAN